MKSEHPHLVEIVGSVSAVPALRKVRDVILVQCSSRGGSSVFMEMMRHSQAMHHLSGEIGPALVMAGAVYPHSGTGSDSLEARHATPEVMRTVHHLLRLDMGNPAAELDGLQARERLVGSLWYRLSVQWPHLQFSHSQISEAVDCALASPLPAADFGAAQRFHAALLLAIRRTHSGVNPWYYDLDPRLIEHLFPAEPKPVGPPGMRIIEEPPFVLTGPWNSVRTADLASKPLIFKTPSNAYRMPFLRALFPDARIRVIHLTRNPAASINGLVDGWRFRGFHAHHVETPLAIDGIPAEDVHWWKYDLPPGWEEWRERSLVEVAGFQWSSAHRAILDAVSTDPQETHRLRFESVVGVDRIGAFESLFKWLELPFDDGMRRVVEEGLPPVMATSRPRQRRWFDRAAEIDPVLDMPMVAEVAAHLGYSHREEWI